MQHVTMRETRDGSPDGVTVNRYAAGETYRVSDDLADVFVSEGWADLVGEPADDAADAGESDPFEGLDEADRELAARVLEHDPEAKPADVAAAIAADRDAVLAALPPADDGKTTEQNPAGIPDPEKPLQEMKLAELRDYAEKIGVDAETRAKLAKNGTSKDQVRQAIAARVDELKKT